MIRRISFAFVFAAFLNLGFGWFGDGQETAAETKESLQDVPGLNASEAGPEGDDSASNPPLQQSTPIKTAGVASEGQEQVNPAEVQTPEGTGRSEGGAAGNITNKEMRKLGRISKIPRVTRSTPDMKIINARIPIFRDPRGLVPPPVVTKTFRGIRPVSTKEINAIQSQIDEIIESNKRFRTLQGDQLTEIARIRDQVAIHKSILNELESVKKEKRQLREADTEEVLRQEKIRLILYQARENKEFLVNLAETDENNEVS